MVNTKEIISENKKRIAELNSPYEPYLGIGSLIPRTKITYKDTDGQDMFFYAPNIMVKDEPIIPLLQKYKSIKKVTEFTFGKSDNDACNIMTAYIHNQRLKYDFEFHAITVGTIKDKRTAKDIRFRLNRPQRKVIKIVYEFLFNNKPVFLEILKARQWGGSTLFENLFFWIQLHWREGWNSAIVADVEDQAKKLRGMLDRVIKNYPKEVKELTTSPFERSAKAIIINELKCIVDIGSMQNPDSLRSGTTYMIHKTEVGFWKKTDNKEPKDIIQSLSQLIPTNLPFTFDIEESTAKGVGGYFHDAWLKAKNGESDHHPVFISWMEDENNTIDIEDHVAFIKTMNEYDWFLWEIGATLEGINWYKFKLKSIGGDHWRMKNENPSTDNEAFESTGARAFPPQFVLNMRKTCMSPVYVGDLFANSAKGENALKNIEFRATSGGNAFVWSTPDKTIKVSSRYITIVDIGGRSEKADFSTINVLDCYEMIEAGCPERVFTWRGHLDQDLIAWKSVQVADWYNHSLLVVEQNSLRKEEQEGDHFLTILDEIKDHYDNLYCRTPLDKIKEGIPARYGFHTDHQSRELVIDNFYAALRDGIYIERDSRCADECDTFERKENGKLEHKEGCHDDILIPTAIGLWIATNKMSAPKLIVEGRRKEHISATEATI